MSKVPCVSAGPASRQSFSEAPSELAETSYTILNPVVQCCVVDLSRLADYTVMRDVIDEIRPAFFVHNFYSSSFDLILYDIVILCHGMLNLKKKTHAKTAVSPRSSPLRTFREE